MRKSLSLCLWITTVLPALVLGRSQYYQQNQHQNIQYTQEQIDNAWIRVPWSNGGFYYHNTLTRHDQDHHPECLSKQCTWKW